VINRVKNQKPALHSDALTGFFYFKIMINASELKEGDAYIVNESFVFNNRKQINKGDIFICTEADRDYDGRYYGEFEIYPEGGWKFYFKGFHRNLDKI